MSTPTTLTICTTCKTADASADDAPAGLQLARASRMSVEADSTVVFRTIACLSNCSRGCSATVAAAGKFAYVIGGLTPADAEALVTFARRHAESADGVPAWRDRPERIRKNTIARVPPSGTDHPLLDPPEGEA